MEFRPTLARHMTAFQDRSAERQEFLFEIPRSANNRDEQQKSPRWSPSSRPRRPSHKAPPKPSRRPNPPVALSPQAILVGPMSAPAVVKCGARKGAKDAQLLPFQPSSPCREKKGEAATCNRSCAQFFREYLFREPVVALPGECSSVAVGLAGTAGSLMQDAVGMALRTRWENWWRH